MIEEPARPDMVKATAIAGGTIALALLDVLVAQGVLTREAALNVLADARRGVPGSEVDPNVKEASLMISGRHQRLSDS